MSISARLFRTLQDTLGEAADDLVTWMQRVDEHRSELRDLNDLSFARVESRFNEERHWHSAQLSEFRRTLDADLAELRQEMRAGFALVREENLAALGAFRDEIKGELGDGLTSLRESQHTLERSLRADFAGLRESQHTLDGNLRADLARVEARLIRWSFAFWATTMLTLVALLR